MRRHPLTPEAAAWFGGISHTPPGPRRSTPPSPGKAVRYRLRKEAVAVAWDIALAVSIAVPLAMAWVAWLAFHL